MHPRLARIPTPLSYRISTGFLTSENFNRSRNDFVDDLVRSARSGVSMLQIREKRLPSSMIFDLVSEVIRRLENLGTLCLVNERVDIALAAGADGVHLTSTSMPLELVRGIAGQKLLIGVSAHSVKEVSSAKDDGADFALFGPVFETPSKSPEIGWQGLGALGEACEAGSPMPVLAVGGVDPMNFKSVLAAGAYGIAAIRLFADPVCEKEIVGSCEVRLS